MKDILRWIAIPFASLLAMLLAGVLAGVFLWLNNMGSSWYTGESPTRLAEIITLLIKDGVAGFAFVYAGVYTAPSHKNVVAIVLATVLTMFSIGSIILTFYLGRDYFSILGAIVTVIGAVFAVSQAKNIE